MVKIRLIRSLEGVVKRSLHRLPGAISDPLEALCAEFNIPTASFDPEQEGELLEEEEELSEQLVSETNFEPIKVYSNADTLRQDSLTELAKSFLEDRIEGRYVVIVERDAQIFRDGVMVIMDKFFPDYGRLKLKSEKPPVKFYLGEPTNVHRFSCEHRDDIIEIQARSKVIGSLTQKLMYLQARYLAGDNKRTLIKANKLDLHDPYAMTILTKTRPQAYEVWKELTEWKKKPASRVVRVFDSEDRYTKNGYFEREMTKPLDDNNPYFAYHVTLELNLEGQRAFFEVHVVDEQADINNNSPTGKASHYELQKRKEAHPHATGGWAFVIVQNLLGMDIEQPSQYQLDIINQTANLNQANKSDPLICYALRPTSEIMKELNWNGSESIFDEIERLENGPT